MKYLLVGVLVVLAIVLPFWSKIFYSDNKTITPKKSKLKRDATIVDISKDIVGPKNDRRFRICVLFSDGYEYVSYKTNRTDGFVSYTISLSEEDKQSIIQCAQSGHLRACRDAGLVPYSCWKCGHKGPYEGPCPECGCMTKRYEE